MVLASDVISGKTSILVHIWKGDHYTVIFTYRKTNELTKSLAIPSSDPNSMMLLVTATCIVINSVPPYIERPQVDRLIQTQAK